MHYLDAELNDLFTRDAALWHYIQQASLDGVWFWDLQRPEHLYISPEYWHVLGIDPSSREHSPDEFIKVVFDDDLPNIMDNLERHYADPSVKYEQIVRFKHIDGSTVWVRCRGKAIRDENGKAIRMLGAHNNITHEMQRQLALEQALATIQQQDAELKVLVKQREQDLRDLQNKRQQEQQMMAVIAHELRTPIATMAMILAEVEQPTSLSPRYLQVVRHAVEQSLNVLGDLKFISQSNQQKPAILKSTNLHMFVTSVYQQLLEIVHNINPDIAFALQCETEIDKLPVVALNTQAFFQVISNLVCNAAKHACCQCIELHVNAAHQGEPILVQIEVRDNGTGIPADELKLLFSAFARGKNTQAEGTGLGLAIATTLVDGLGGELQYRDNAPTGSIFSFAFQVEATAIQEQSGVQADVISNKRILFVEDNHTIQVISQLALEKAGAEVVMAEHGVEALQLIEGREKFDYIFTDIFMPQMNGYELCRHLRQQKIVTPIIAVTASVLGDEVEQALASGADAVVEKPMSIPHVQQVLNQIVS